MVASIDFYAIVPFVPAGYVSVRDPSPNLFDTLCGVAGVGDGIGIGVNSHVMKYSDADYWDVGLSPYIFDTLYGPVDVNNAESNVGEYIKILMFDLY